MVRHPDVALLQSYVDEGIPVHTRYTWSLQALEIAISKGPHAYACTPEMTTFIWEEMQRRIKYGFSILLPATGAVQIFGEKLNLSCIVEVTQAHHHPCLILNLSGKAYEVTPSVNDTINRESAPDSLQFVRALPRILWSVW